MRSDENLRKLLTPSLEEEIIKVLKSRAKRKKFSVSRYVENILKGFLRIKKYVL